MYTHLLHRNDLEVSTSGSTPQSPSAYTWMFMCILYNICTNLEKRWIRKLFWVPFSQLANHGNAKGIFGCCFCSEYLQGCPKFCSLFCWEPQGLSKYRTSRIKAVFLSRCFSPTSCCKERLKRRDFVRCELCVNFLLHWHPPQIKK